MTRVSPETANRWVSERRAKGDSPVTVLSAERGDTRLGGAWSGLQPEASAISRSYGLKDTPLRADFHDMADLSNLLGAVYGESSPPKSPSRERDPDGPPTPVEKAADERAEAEPGPLADDLAAALSEALVAQEAEDAQSDDMDADYEDAYFDADDAGDEDPTPQLSPERAAAVELMHASRPDSESLGPVEPKPLAPIEPIAIEDLPYTTDQPKPAAEPTPQLAPAPLASAPTTRWDRSDDDILPAKSGGGKKFFSLSLRRG